MFLSNLSIQRPVFATVMMLALVTLGLFSYRRLAIDMFPDVEIPVVSILTEYPGASPETVEREVTKRIEEAVNPIAGVKHVMSSSREGLSNVVVQFELEVKINEASQEARAKINAIRNELPAGIEEPVIQKLDIAGSPVISLAVKNPNLSPRDLTTLIDRKVRRRLENVTGVGKVKIIGGSWREVNVNVDPARIEAMGLGVDEVISGLSSENVNTPLGRLNRARTEVPLRVAGKPAAVPDFASMVIGQRGSYPVKLGDAAEIVDGIEEQRSLALINGEPAIAVDVMKQSKANTVGVVDAVKAEVKKLEAELPSGTTITVVRDGSTFIRESVEDVKNTMIIGGLLTVLIVFCFLNSWRSTVITGLTLPISVISAFIAMYFLGMTLNVLTLMALSLAIGLLIDDAIVVRENIVRHLERGQDHLTAAREGTAEIGLAVLATTMSIIAVFVPVAYMKGVIGRFFFQFGITVAFAVLVSLFVSFTLDPMLSSRWYDPDIERKGKRHMVARILDRFNEWFERTANVYKSLIGWVLGRRAVVAGIATAAFVGGLFLFFQLQVEFMPTWDRGEFQVKLKTAPDASIEETKARLGMVLNTLGRIPDIEHTYAAIAPADTDTVRDALVFVKLKDRAERSRPWMQLLADVRTQLQEIPGIQISVEENTDSMAQKPLQINLRGEDIPKLKTYAAALKNELYKLRGIVDLEVSLEHDLPEYRLIVNRERAAAAGLGTRDIVRAVGALVGGQVVSTYEDEAGEAVDVRVRLPETLRRDIQQVGNLRLSVRNGDGQATLVPLAELTSYERVVSPSEINRQDLSRQVVISANLDALPLGTGGARALEAAQKVPMEPGYRVMLSGDTEMMEESFGYLGEALVLAVIFVYLILAAQFESFIDPLAIMFSLPLSIVGMAGMLYLTGDTVNIMSLIGLILLMGLVTKNAILLVDFTKVLRKRGMSREEALITAGRTRLRPILMTTMAMIFGMLPLAFALGAGAEMRAPMARAVVGGLITSTLLTLLVVPVVYTVLDDIAAWVRRRWRGQAVAANAVAGALLLMLMMPGTVRGQNAGRSEDRPLQAREQRQPTEEGRSKDRPLQGQKQPAEVLTLERAVEIAADKNRDIQKARAYQQWVRGKYVEERAAALPHLTASAGTQRAWDGSFQALFGNLFPARQGTHTMDVSVSQAVFNWGKTGAAVRAAREGIASADDQLNLYRQTAIRDVSVAFYDVLLAKELHAIAKQTLDQKQRHLDEARHKYELGTATDYDVLAAEVAVKNARPEVIRTENLIRTARERLNFLLAGEGQGLEVSGALETTLAPHPSYEEVLVQAWKNRPELAEMEHRAAVARELVKISRAGDKPQIDFRAATGWKKFGAGGLEADGKTWNIGLYLSFPFFDGFKTSGQVQQAQSDQRTLEIETERIRDAIRLDVRTAVDAVGEAAEIVNALLGTEGQARRLLEMAEQGFDLGVKTRLEVEDAQLNVSQAQANLARARRDYMAARVQLEWVRGSL